MNTAFSLHTRIKLLPFIRSSSNRFLIFTALVLSCFAGYSQNTGTYRFLADSNGSFSTDRNGSHINPMGWTSLIATNQQHVNSATTALPFPVFFMGRTFTHFMVNVNGALILAPSASIAFTANTANNYTSVNSQYAVIAPFWDVLKTASNEGVKYQVSGTAPFRCLTVEWHTTTSSKGTDDMQFQARLYEASNIVEFIYGQMRITQPLSVPVSASVGFSVASAVIDSSFVSLLKLDTPQVTRLRNNLTASQNLVNTTDTGVINGLHAPLNNKRTRFAWVPDILTAPVNLTAFNITQNNALLYWDDNTGNENGFRVFRLKAGEVVLDTTVAPNITFRDAYNLLPGTTYQYYVQVYNDYTASYSNLVSFRTNDVNTLVAAQSGMWNDPATWGGSVPSLNDSVVIPAGIKVVMNATQGICNDLNVTGTLEYEDAGLVRRLTVNHNMMVNGRLHTALAPTFNAQQHELNVGGDYTSNGYTDLYVNTGTYISAVTLKFTGDEASVFTAASDTTNLFQLSLTKNDANDSLIIKGTSLWIKNSNTDLANILFSNITHKGAIRIGGTFALQNRLFASNTIGTASALSVAIDNANLTISSAAGDVTLNNGCAIRMIRGTWNITGALNLNTGSALTVNGGLITIGGQLKNTSTAQPASFIQTGGQIFTNGVTLNAAANAISMWGGELFTTNNSTILADLLRSTFTGTKVQFGLSDGNTAPKTMLINGHFPQVIIDSVAASNKVVKVTLNGPTFIYGKAWIGSTDTLDLAGYELDFAGDSLIAEGAVKGAANGSRLSFVSASEQFVTGTGSMSLNAMEVDKKDTSVHVTIECNNHILVNNLWLSGGSITHANKLQIGDGISNASFHYGKSTDIQQGGYLDTLPVYPSNTSKYFIYYSHEPVARSTGYEIPSNRHVAGIFFSNRSGITVAGGSITVTDTLRLDSGMIYTASGNEIILADTLNPTAITGGGNNSYFKGPFIRRIAAGNTGTYIFPVGDNAYKPFVISNPVAAGTSDIRVFNSKEKANGVTGADLRSIDTTGYWYTQLVSGPGLNSYQVRIYHTNLVALSRLVVSDKADTILTGSDTFDIIGKRVSFYIDTLESGSISNMLNTTTPVNFFAKGFAEPDTLFAGTYRIGDGEQYQNLTAVADAINNSFIDGPLVFEVTSYYDTQSEKFPIAFEQAIYTNSPQGKNITLKLGNNVTGVISSNGSTALPANNSMINLLGIDSFTIDGRGYDILGQLTGTIEWTFKTATNTTNVPVFRFANDASFNTFEWIRVYGNAGSTGSILFDTKAEDITGNDNNNIKNCHLTSESFSLQGYAHIIAKGNNPARHDHNSITGNNISDFSGRGIEIGANSGANWNISNNNFYQTATSANTSIALNFIPGAGSGNNIISGNIFGGASAGATALPWTYSGTGVLTMMQVDADSTDSSVVTNNIIRNFNTTSNSTAAGFMGINALNGNLIVSGNTIGGPAASDVLTIAGRGVITLINSLVSTGSFRASDNTLSNVNQSVALSTSTRVRGIAHMGAASANISNNIITNLVSRGSNTDYKDAALAGIYITSTSDAVSIGQNTITGLSMLSNGCVNAICINSNASGNIFNNTIYDLSSASATATRYIIGINIENGVWNITNNKVSILNTGNEARTIVLHGIRVVSTSPVYTNIFYNTIYIGGTANGTATTSASSAYAQQNSSYCHLKNNLFINNRIGAAGIHNAVSVTGNWINTISDFNVYYAINATLMMGVNGVAIPFQTFVNNNNTDRNSISGTLPSFVSIPSNLNLKDTSANCLLKGSGVPVAGFVTDFDGDARNNVQPDPGADEFTYTSSMPAAPLLFSGNDTLCQGEPRTIRMSIPAGGNDIEWYAQPNGGNILDIGSDFTTGPITSDTAFYAQVRTGTCKSFRTRVDVKVKTAPLITVSRAPSGIVCAGSTHTLSVNTASDVTVQWFSDSTLTTSFFTGTTYTTPVLSNDTTFYVVASNNTCPSRKVSIHISVDPNLVLPAPVTDTLVGICIGEPIVLKASSADTLAWFATASSSAVLSSDSISLPNLQRDTVFYVSAKRFSCESERVKVMVKAYKNPVLPAIDSVIYTCYKQDVTISAVPAEGTLAWFDDSLNTTPFFTGNQFTITAPETDTVYYYQSQNGTCAATDKKAVRINVNKPATPQNDPVNAICINHATTLVINNAGTGIVKWYGSLTDNNALFTGNAFQTGNLDRDTIFYVNIEEGNCSSERISIPVDVIEQAAAPVLVSIDSVCKGGVATITATGFGIRWYATATSTDVLGSDTFFTPDPLYNDTSFYMVSVYGNCVSERVAVNVLLKAAPQPPLVIPPDAICSGQSVQLNATATDSVKWYANTTAINPIMRGNVFTTPKLSANTTYYIEQENGTCKSNRIPVVITVAASPAPPVVSETNYRTCYNEPIALKAIVNGSGSNIARWYGSANSLVVLQIDSMLITDRLTADSTFYVETFNGTCGSARVAVPVAVLNYIGNVQIVMPDSVLPGEDVTIESQGPISSIYSWNFGQGASLSGASGQGPFTLHYTTSGEKTISLSLSRKSGNLNCDTIITQRLVVKDTTRTGLGEADLYRNISIYPNPVKDVLHITFELFQSSDIAISLHDAAGRLVWEEQQDRVNAYDRTLDVSEFRKGFYILHILNQGQTTFKKIIIE